MRGIPIPKDSVRTKTIYYGRAHFSPPMWYRLTYTDFKLVLTLKHATLVLRCDNDSHPTV